MKPKKKLVSFILAFIFPGLGFFYLGKTKKAAIYILLYIALLILSYKLPLIILVALVGWVYNIYDTIKDTKLFNANLKVSC